jgi:RND family efflux transporter MFP subunit
LRQSDPNQPASESHQADLTKQELEWQIEELKRRLREERERNAGAPPNRWKPSGITITALLLIVVVLFAGAFYAGYVPLQKREALIRSEADDREKGLPRVAVMKVSRAGGRNQIKLPGTMQAVTEAPILARADGYLKRRLVDIGDRVKAGQTLAEIDAPELDQQIRQAEAAVEQVQASLEQAQASLEQGRANREIARITAGRWKQLAAQGVVSKQENDQYQAQLTAQDANVQALEKAIAAQRSNLAAAQANVARLQEVQGYRTVKAPFDGVVTVRNVDQGALVSTGNTLLYRIAQTDTLRTYVSVPQINANSVHVGQAAELTLSNYPGRRFRATVARTANALDPASRTMLVEVDVPNPDGALYPGMYAEVELITSQANPPLVVPAQALITRTDGAQVAEVGSDGILHIRKVTIGRDYGDRVEILQGLSDGATIVASPGDAVRDGVKVEAVEQP